MKKKKNAELPNLLDVVPFLDNFSLGSLPRKIDLFPLQFYGQKRLVIRMKQVALI